jgi:NDP-sugar pyrophosphorylase family protein
MRPIVLQLIDRLVRGGTRALSVCANGRTGLYAARLNRESLGLGELCFVQDPLPRGPAGCLKDNQAFVCGETFLVANAACLFDEPVASLVERHAHQRNHLTVFCLPHSGAPGGIYVCEPAILDHIPAVGYCDIKEQLIPRLIDRGLQVGALPLRGPGVEVLNVKTYLHLHHHVLATNLEGQVRSCPGEYHRWAPDVWVSSDARIGKRTRLFGPLIVGPGATIRDGAVVIGPGSVGPQAHIAEDAVATECAVWANAVVPPGQCIDRQLVIPEDRRPVDLRSRRAARDYVPALPL